LTAFYYVIIKNSLHNIHNDTLYRDLIIFPFGDQTNTWFVTCSWTTNKQLPLSEKMDYVNFGQKFVTIPLGNYS